MSMVRGLSASNWRKNTNLRGLKVQVQQRRETRGQLLRRLSKTRYRTDPYVVSAHVPLADFDPD